MIKSSLNSYFAWPLATQESGGNENPEGLLQQSIPQKLVMDTVTVNEIKII